jgi:hypothetical protein
MSGLHQTGSARAVHAPYRLLELGWSGNPLQAVVNLITSYHGVVAIGIDGMTRDCRARLPAEEGCGRAISSMVPARRAATCAGAHRRHSCGGIRNGSAPVDSECSWPVYVAH